MEPACPQHSGSRLGRTSNRAQRGRSDDDIGSSPQHRRLVTGVFFLRLPAIIHLMFSATGVMNRGAMKHTTKKQQKQTPTSGFAIPLTDSTDLGLAMLIAEFEDGQYEPVGVVASIREAREIAESDLQGRMRCLERGDDPGRD